MGNGFIIFYETLRLPGANSLYTSNCFVYPKKPDSTQRSIDVDEDLIMFFNTSAKVPKILLQILPTVCSD